VSDEAHAERLEQPAGSSVHDLPVRIGSGEGPPSEMVLDGRIVRAAHKRERRRQMVLDTALRVFSERGYHQTRISDIIEAAGIARGTFYLYFDSKNAIFHELLDLLLERIRGNVVGVDLREGAPPVREQLLVSVQRVLRAFHESPALTRFVLRESAGIDVEIDKKLSGFYGSLHGWLRTSLERGASMGLLRALDTEYVAWCILGSVKQVTQLVLDRPAGDVRLEHLAEAVLDLHLQGIVAPGA
jgi:AcrR family transcriptional regulator